jgi:predicted sulfurtransferase/23S rRNA-/tRNA-specific pseudouridylate synthase
MDATSSNTEYAHHDDDEEEEEEEEEEAQINQAQINQVHYDEDAQDEEITTTTASSQLPVKKSGNQETKNAETETHNQAACATDANANTDANAKSYGIILFYKYHPLSDCRKKIELFRQALQGLCLSLELKGRILIGCSMHKSEGINGTLSGSISNLNTFVSAFTTTTTTATTPEEEEDGITIQQLSLSSEEEEEEEATTNYNRTKKEEKKVEVVETNDNDDNDDTAVSAAAAKVVAIAALRKFHQDCNEFYRRADCPYPLTMTKSEFKWSRIDKKQQQSSSDEKSSQSSQSHNLFPDLNIKIVTELIGTGGVLSKIPLTELQKGYLTPKQWHERLIKLEEQESKNNNEDSNNNNDINDTILIDCRNTKEHAIGNFGATAINPNTTTFNQFPKWVHDNQHKLKGKNVLMYCTGGIRCEKASAYIRNTLKGENGVKDVHHLQGGIHKYIEQYPGTNSGSNVSGSNVSDGSGPNSDSGDGNNNNNNINIPSTSSTSSLWRGKNFVFDGRGAHGGGDRLAATATDPSSSSSKMKDVVVGECRYCNSLYDTFDPHCICTVCREPILICMNCQSQQPQFKEQQTQQTQTQQTQQGVLANVNEYHCITHQHLETCYFTNLQHFSLSELKRQLKELTTIGIDIAIGKKYKRKRKTLTNQCLKIQTRINELLFFDGSSGSAENSGSSAENSGSSTGLKCRNCEQLDCSGKCWGFHSLKRKRVLDEQQQKQNDEKKKFKYNNMIQKKANTTTRQQKNQNEILKLNKQIKKQKQIEDLIQLGLISQSPEIERDPITGLRTPKPCTRIIQTTTKGKWCGVSLLKVLQQEFFNHNNNSGSSSGSGSGCGENNSRNNNNDNNDNNDIVLRQLLTSGLIRVNGIAIARNFDEANDYKLKNMDIIDRIIHWHEPPVFLPSFQIDVKKIILPKELVSLSLSLGSNNKKKKKKKRKLSNNNDDDDDDGTLPTAVDVDNDSNNTNDNTIYVCNKPCTVPVHPTGPYLSNTLTMLVEGQEQKQHNLKPMTLIPCHRIDRVTSGIVICSTNKQIVSLISQAMSNNTTTSTITTAYTANTASTNTSINTSANTNTNTDSNGCNNNYGRRSSYVRKKYLAKVIGEFPSQCNDESGSSNNGCSALPDHSTSIAQWEWIIDRNKDDYNDNNDNENTVVVDNNKIDDSFSSSLSSSSSFYNVATASTADNDNDNATTTTIKTTATTTTMNKNDNNRTLKVDGPIETIDPANGIRSITSNGKPSISLFRLLNYDPISNTSVIICEPKTGRSHQLRVHLQWLGHSICGDILYGGGSDSGGGDSGAGVAGFGFGGCCTTKLIDDPNAGINRLLDSINDDYDVNNADTSTSTTTLCSDSITPKQAHAAKEVCPTCSRIHNSSNSNTSEGGGRDGGGGVRKEKGTGHPSTSFTSAQLLQGGHAICLHAFCYGLVFPNTTTTSTTTASLSSSFKIDLKVDLPPWASHLRNKK